MVHDCWQVTFENGFLIYPDPITDLRKVDSSLDHVLVERLEVTAAELPDLIERGVVREVLAQMPVYDLSPVLPRDPRILERLHLLYTYFTNAYIHMGDSPTQHLPASVAVPVVFISEQVNRPPIVSHTGMVLNNWRRINPDDGLSLDNLELLQAFSHLYDEEWFFLVHVAIEARAGQMLAALNTGLEAARHDDSQTVMGCLQDVRSGLADIIKIFHRMPEHCDPDRFYQQVRKPLFSLNDVIFEGVNHYNDQPKSFMGGSAAQSSIIPAVLAALGIKHQGTQLTDYLTAVRSYMPQQHKDFVDRMTTDELHDYCQKNPGLHDAYNQCVRQVITFRRAHFYYARKYVFERVAEPVGTGGTEFMHFLNLLIEETETYLF